MTARLTPRPGGPARLRALLESGQTILAPGAFDPLSARLVEAAGFPAVYMTGFGTSAALIEALTTEAEAAEAARAFPGVPLLFNWAEGGKTPPVSLDRIKELGYRIVIFPISTLLAATGAMRRILREIAQAGTPAAAMHDMPTFAEFADFIGLPQVRQAEQRYAVKPGPQT